MVPYCQTMLAAGVPPGLVVRDPDDDHAVVAGVADGDIAAGELLCVGGRVELVDPAAGYARRAVLPA